ncbi:uncharacterized protein N7477_006352 [Penicillium maclennaniae]|uniref:uncharacterized protein n=1 Tax=Penicillium maclennaniae TaxID=1343394 RepID=UPI002540122E|nr:uncharacterized protein N7477_006352 [Penicillium maclennaniae]KAJ5667782.1 hypothetical protein N7477_006352 [Penicillium maclennaniae]
MKVITAISALLFIGAATADIQSKPFNLVIQSAKKSIDGQKLAACHSGAAIESLCLAGSGSNFHLNTTQGEQAPIKGQGIPGTLVWRLPYTGEGNKIEYESEPMSFYSDPSTNVAMPLFEPGYDVQSVMFDKDGKMGIYSYLDDTVSPPTGDKVKILRNWYICETYYSAYTYHTLNWVLGDAKAKPQNPSCVKVVVERKFI